MKKFVIIALCLSLIGCSSLPHMIKPYSDPQYGMTKKEMFEQLGRPESVEIYKKTNMSFVEFYIYDKKYGDSVEQVPIGVIDNKVVGWGKTFYEDHISQDDIRIK